MHEDRVVGVVSDEAMAGARRRRRRRRSTRRLRWRRLGPLLGVVAGLVFLLGLWTALRVHTARAEYAAAVDELGDVQTLARGDLSTLSADDVVRLRSDLEALSLHVERLVRATTLPAGIDRVAARLPWLGPRYQAAHDVLAVARLLSDAGETVAGVGQETLTAFAKTGATADSAPRSPTWLDVLGSRQPDLERAAAQVEQARALRASLDESVLPGPIRSRLGALDRAMDRLAGAGRLAGSDLPAIRAALGGDQPVRYLMLFQNPAELRPGGGFPGTMALVTVERGQIRSYEFFNSHKLTDDYIAQRREKLPQPWPIQQFFPQDGLLLHDATWWADFPRGAAQTMAMYAETSWPPINGVIAIQPAVVSDLLRVTGPITLDVDGEPRRITPDNLYDEIERQRRLVRAGQHVETTHKELIALIGEAVVERLKSADRPALARAAKALRAAAARRDIQVYSANDDVEALVDRHGWTGRLVPDPKVPTLAVTLANLAINKASLEMQPAMTLTLDPPSGGARRATLDIDLTHTGSNEEDPLYGGFQKWWIEVNLPDGSRDVSADPAPQPNPEAPNGGSYVVDLFPRQTGHVHVSFTLPDRASLLLRRQPGPRPFEVTVKDTRCGAPATAKLTADVRLDLASLCR